MAALAGTTSLTHAENSTVAGSAIATPGSPRLGGGALSIQAPYAGDDNRNNTLLIEWGLDGVGFGLGSQVLPNAPSPYAWTITGLDNSQKYQVRITWQDATDGPSPQQSLTGLRTYQPLLHNAVTTGSGTSKWPSGWGTADPGSKYGEFTCKTCHGTSDVHPKRIRKTILSPNTGIDDFPGSAVTFADLRDGSSHFGDDSGGHLTSSHICEVCHSRTSYHRYSTAAQPGGTDHYNRTDCIVCHSHGDGFKATCTGCHGSAAGNIWPDGVPGAYPDRAGSHTAHVRAIGLTLGYGDFYTSMYSDLQQKTICAFCHPDPGGSGHLIDSGDARADLAGAEAFLKFLGTGVTAADTGSGAYDYSALSCSNLACHNQVTTPSGAYNWSVPPAANCTTLCHPAASYSNRHDIHVTTKGYACTECHPHHDTNYRHGDGQVQLVWTNTGSFEQIYGGGSITYGQASPLLYKDATWGSCASAACHNNKTTPVWNAATTGACTVCHTVGGAGANPTTGLHTITVAGVQKHDHTLGTTGCRECHGPPPPTHVNGTFIANSSGNADRFVTRSGMIWTDNTSNRGTCSGNGLSGCHSDGGGWARLWSAEANSTATVAGSPRCNVCHGQWSSLSGSAGWREGTSHYGAGTLNMTGNTRGQVHDAVANCDACHAYVSVSGKHNTITPRITLNASGPTGFARNGAASGCLTCHGGGADPEFNFPVSVFLSETVAGTPLTCTSCHTGTGSGALGVGPGSSHVKADGIAFGACTDCHSRHAGGTPGPGEVDIPTTYGAGILVPTMNHQYASHGSKIRLGGTRAAGASEAEICWGCHDAVTTASRTLTGVNVAFTNTSAAVGTITAAGIGAKFRVGDWITVTGASSAANNRTFRVATVAADSNSLTVNIKTGDGPLVTAASAAGITVVSPISEWGVNQKAETGNLDYDYGYLYTGSTSPGAMTSNWVTGIWRSGKGRLSGTGYGAYNPFWYKQGAIQSTHSVNFDRGTSVVSAGNSLGYNRTAGADAAADIRCSYCHDVHGTHVGVNGDLSGPSATTGPYLRGTWKGNPYPEDGAPQWGMANWTVDTPTANTYGRVPRASAAAGNSGLSTVARAGGWWIEQNSGNPNWRTDVSPNRLATATETAGLCDQCHGSAAKDGVWTAAEIGSIDQLSGENLWISGYNGHASVVLGGPGRGTIGSAESFARNIYTRAKRGTSAVVIGSSNKTNVDMGLATEATGNYGYSYRANTSGYSFTPRIATTSTTAAGTSQPFSHRYFVWGGSTYQTATPGSAIATGTVALQVANTSGKLSANATEAANYDAQANYHTFNCAKCHNPHASRLPKLMITNCLDTNHNSWDDGYNNTTSGLAAPWANSLISQWGAAQNCHRLDSRASLSSGASTTRGPGWNKVTPWLEDTTPDTYSATNPNP